MRYKLLGRSALRVSELCLGTMTFGEDWGWGASQAESRRIFDVFANAGGNFVDTSNNYTNGTSEQYVGEFIAADRDHFVVATKFTLSTRRDDPNSGGNHRKNMVQAVNASLRRLNTEYIDLLWLHMWDYTTPVAEIMRGLDDLARAGKILHAGISDSPAWVAAQANTLAELRGWTPFTALQLPYSLLSRDPERELLPMAQAFDMAVTPWGVLEDGLLSGKFNKPQAGSTPSRISPDHLSERALSRAAQVAAIAEELGVTPAQAAINWVRQQPGVIVPILGARTAGQMQENLGCLNFQLDAAHLEKLSQVSEFRLGFPRAFLESDHVRDLIFGETFSLVDNHHAA